MLQQRTSRSATILQFSAPPGCSPAQIQGLFVPAPQLRRSFPPVGSQSGSSPDSRPASPEKARLETLPPPSVRSSPRSENCLRSENTPADTPSSARADPPSADRGPSTRASAACTFPPPVRITGILHSLVC